MWAGQPGLESRMGQTEVQTTGSWGKKTAVRDHLLDLPQQLWASESSKESYYGEKVMQAQIWGSQDLGSFGCMDETNMLDGDDNSTLFLWLFPSLTLFTIVSP